MRVLVHEELELAEVVEVFEMFDQFVLVEGGAVFELRALLVQGVRGGILEVEDREGLYGSPEASPPRDFDLGDLRDGIFELVEGLRDSEVVLVKRLLEEGVVVEEVIPEFSPGFLQVGGVLRPLVVLVEDSIDIDLGELRRNIFRLYVIVVIVAFEFFRHLLHDGLEIDNVLREGSLYVHVFHLLVGHHLVLRFAERLLHVVVEDILVDPSISLMAPEREFHSFSSTVI